MADIITDNNPVTLADFESLTNDKPIRSLMHTIRDYTPIFDQAVIQAGNDGFGDRGKIITTYPEGQLRAFNEGWDTEKVHGSDVRYRAGMMRTRSEVDRDLYNTRPAAERDAWRFRKDQGFMRGLARKVVKTMFYGSAAADPRGVDGLGSIVTPANEAFADRIINGGGTTAAKQTDIWLVNWDAEACFCFYPQNGSQAGLRVENMGEHYAFDANGKRFLALITEFAWDLGVALYDPEKIVRIANIDTAKYSIQNNKGGGAANLIDLMTQAIEMLPDDQTGRVTFYMNDAARSVLRRQIVNKDNVLLNMDEVAGRKVLTFAGVPVHKVGTDIIPNNMNVLA